MTCQGDAPNAPLWQRLLSRCIQKCVCNWPFSRGKWRVLQMARLASPFLMTQLDAGPWIRVSGASVFEWNAFRQRHKEPNTLATFMSLLQSGMAVFDVGANIGLFTLVAASRVGAEGRVFAFEPTPLAFRRLLENVRLNGFTNITSLHSAVSDVVGIASFFVNPAPEDSEGNSLFASAVAPDSSEITVPVATLDDVVRQMRFPGVDVLKIDVEGNEVRVLRGAHAILSGSHPPKILMEVNPLTLQAAGFDSDAVFLELTALGYKWKTIEQISWRGCTIANILACREP